MKVLHLYTSTRSFFENQLTALERQGVDCAALPVPGTFEPGSYRSVTDYARYVPMVLREARRGDYDVVHANWGLMAPFALAQPVRPVVLTLWGSDLMSDRRWLTAICRFGARHADAVVLPSPAMAPALDADHDLVPFGIDLELFRPIPRAEAREVVGWEHDRRYVLFPYRPDRPEKHYWRARATVERADVDATLVQVDDVPYEEMPYFINASDALLVTSRRESGPMVVKEAAACNVPVVSTDVGFVRSVLDGVTNSHVCESDDALVAALEDVLSDAGRSDGRDALSDAGLDVMGERLLAVYRRALEERGASVEPTTPVGSSLTN